MLDSTHRVPDAPPRREPVFNIPGSVLVVILGLVGIHGLRQFIPGSWDTELFLRLAFVPGTITAVFDPARVNQSLMGLAMQGESGLRLAQIGRLILQGYGVEPWTVLSYGLLHASWAHVGLNTLWLLAFGTPVARRLGAMRFILFLCGGTIAGAILHYLTHMLDMTPTIGASAAVSGCMGAALRFMFRPAVPISALISLADGSRRPVARPPLLGLRAMLRDRRAVTFLVAWFLTNLLFGIGSLSLDMTGGTVAWEAHIGGFLFGLFLLPVFDGPADPPPLADDADAGPPEPDP